MTDTAFVFPGQGSQSVGMLSVAHATWPQIAETFSEASEALGFDLWRMASEGPAETLALTANTQPLILTASVALYRAYLAAGGDVPTVVAGHSLGEFSALVAAESVAFPDAVMLVRRRGEAMQEAVPVGVGAMAAIIGLDDESINLICREVSLDGDHLVLAVNYNSPGQVVIAGHAGAVDQAVVALKAAGAKRAMPLPVSAPFHTPLMHYAGEVLAEALSTVEVKDPIMPVISNVDAAPQLSGADIRVRLVKQVSSPVMWASCVSTMIGMGCEDFVECGPARVLSGLIRRIDKSKCAFSLETPEDMQATLAHLG